MIPHGADVNIVSYAITVKMGDVVSADADVRIGRRTSVRNLLSGSDREEIGSTIKRSRVIVILLRFLMANNAEDLHEEKGKWEISMPERSLLAV